MKRTWTIIGVSDVPGSAVMAALALGVVSWAEHHNDHAVARTMGLTTLSLMHVAAALEAREADGTIFTRYTIANGGFVQLMGAALVLTFLVTSLGPLQRIFDTLALSGTRFHQFQGKLSPTRSLESR